MVRGLDYGSLGGDGPWGMGCRQGSLLRATGPSPSLGQLVLHIHRDLVNSAVPLDPDLAGHPPSGPNSPAMRSNSQPMKDRINNGSLLIEPACYTFDHGTID